MTGEKGWRRAKLSEIADVDPKNPTEVPQDDEHVTFLPMAAAEALSGRINATQKRRWGEVKKGYTRFQDGDVLFAKITPSMENGKIVLAQGLENGVGAGSTEFLILRPNDRVDSKYVLYYLLQEGFRRNARAHMTGTAGQLRVPKRFLEEHELPLPSISTQQAVVEAIESHMSRLDSAMKSLKAVQLKLEKYRASVLKAAVEGRLVPTEAELARKEGRDYEPASVLLERILKERKRRWIEDAAERGRAKAEQKAKKAGKAWTEEDDAKALESERAKAAKKYKEPVAPDTEGLPELPEGWCWATAAQLLWSIEGGNSGTAVDEPTGRMVLRSSAVRQDHIDFSDFRFFPNQVLSKTNGTLTEGDLLFTRLSGTLAYVGNCAVVPDLRGLVMEFPDRIYRGRIADPRIAKYLCLCFAVPTLRHQIEDVAKSAAGHQRIGIDDIARYAVPLPPLSESRRIVDTVSRARSVSDVVTGVSSTEVSRMSTLRQAILRDAFSGQLAEKA